MTIRPTCANALCYAQDAVEILKRIVERSARIQPLKPFRNRLIKNLDATLQYQMHCGTGCCSLLMAECSRRTKKENWDAHARTNNQKQADCPTICQSLFVWPKERFEDQIFKLFVLATNCGIFNHKTFSEKKINMSKQGTVIDCNESYSSAH